MVLAPHTTIGNSLVQGYVTPSVQQQTSYGLPQQTGNIISAGNLSAFNQPPVLVILNEQANSGGSFDNGNLHGAVDATAPTTIVCGYGVNGLPNVCTNGSTVTSHLYLLWQDWFVGVSSSVSTYRLSITQHFDGSINVQGPIFSGAHLDAYDQLDVGSYHNVFQTGAPGAFDFTLTSVVTAAVGDVVDIEEQLLLDAEAGDFYGPMFSSVGALDTASITIQVLTPGVTLVTASGLLYAPQAAASLEPTTLALLGVGLAGLGFSRRRKLN